MRIEQVENNRLYQKIRMLMNHGLSSFLRENLAGDGDGLRVLEIACGSGYAAHLLAQDPRIGLSIAGDINRDDFDQASILNFQANFVIMDIYSPALQPDAMDLVWNSSSIEELSAPKDAIISMARLVKPGGLIFIGVPNQYGLAGLLATIPNTRIRQWLGRTFTRAGLRKLAAGTGLTIEKEITYLLGTFLGLLARKDL